MPEPEPGRTLYPVRLVTHILAGILGGALGASVLVGLAILVAWLVGDTDLIDPAPESIATLVAMVIGVAAVIGFGPAATQQMRRVLREGTDAEVHRCTFAVNLLATVLSASWFVVARPALHSALALETDPTLTLKYLILGVLLLSGWMSIYMSYVASHESRHS